MTIKREYAFYKGVSMDCIERSKEIRSLTMQCIASIGVGHIGGCLSLADLLAVLYTKHMNIDPKNPHMKGRDRLVLSKGHAGPALYATLASFGYFPKEELNTLNKIGTKLPSHCNMNLTTGVDMTTGSLGQGFSTAVGMALAGCVSKKDYYTYAILGDGEIQEGQIWEACMYAGGHGLDHLIGGRWIPIIIAIIIAMLVYVAVVLKIGTLSDADIEALPMGARLLRLCRKLRLMPAE